MHHLTQLATPTWPQTPNFPLGSVPPSPSFPSVSAVVPLFCFFFFCRLCPSHCPINVSMAQVLAQALFSPYTFLPSNLTYPLITIIYLLLTIKSDHKHWPFSWFPDPNSQMTKGIFTWLTDKHLKINMSKTELILFLWKSNSISLFSGSVTYTTHLPHPALKLQNYVTPDISLSLTHYSQAMTKSCWCYLSPSQSINFSPNH